MLGLPAQKIAQGAKQGKAVYNNLDSQSKTAVNIATAVGALGALFVGYKLVSGIGDILKTATGQKWNEDRKEEESEDRANLTDHLKDEQEKPSLTEDEAKNVAAALYNGFLNTQPEWSENLWDEGTDETAVYNALKVLKNRADWLLVSIKYGMPRRRNLASELLYELSSGSEQQKARDILAKINVKI